MPRISAAILTFNRRDAVLKAIQSVYDQDYTDFEIVVVDSASRDGTPEAIRSRFPDVKIVRLPRNLGCPGGRNHVFANCIGDYIVCIDDDGFLGQGALSQIAAAFDSDPRIGIISMRQKFVDEPDDDVGHAISDSDSDVGNFRGGVCSFRRSTLEKIGFYPEDFFLYAEESYVALLAMSAGYRIVSRPGIIMWHPRIGTSAGKKWDYYRYRNPLLVVIRLFPGWLMPKYLFLRLASYAMLSLKRGTVRKYLAAIASVFAQLPRTLWRRQPVSREAVERYFKLRGPGRWGNPDA